jgi:hypothetical protein
VCPSLNFFVYVRIRHFSYILSNISSQHEIFLLVLLISSIATEFAFLSLHICRNNLVGWWSLVSIQSKMEFNALLFYILCAGMSGSDILIRNHFSHSATAIRVWSRKVIGTESSSCYTWECYHARHSTTSALKRFHCGAYQKSDELVLLSRIHSSSTHSSE